MFRKFKKIHFIGIGGIGMSGIAELLLNLNFEVTGSDLRLTETTRHLEEKGATVFEGHHPDNVDESDVVVYSSAVTLDNSEIQSAKDRKIPIIRRAEMLGELLKLKMYSIAIAGTHGKTTTTSMVGNMMTAGGFDPTLIIGGIIKNLKSNALLGQGDYVVAEADEFDRTFLSLMPTIAIITNIEKEHLDTYSDLDDLKGAFIQFANKVPFYGVVIACLDEPSVQDIIPDLTRRVITYGFSPQADVRATNVNLNERISEFEVIVEDKSLGTVALNVPGEHNIKNAIATIALGLELGIDFESIKKGLESYETVNRRFEFRGQHDDILFVDDYAHHPTEVLATLEAAKKGWQRRVVAVFQPHLYTRTRDFKDDFGKAFLHSDVLFVTDIYPSREEPIPNVTGQVVADAARGYGHKQVHYIEDKEDLPRKVGESLLPGDIVITLGAGDITKFNGKILEYYKTHNG
ncbi:MAG: UDP-N-acetylmuramate--L-alanine ligase [Candidatus Marinimicrobia bacterium]|nr:UDP-N-acetylmuramate--L-alanine ligase [Candidatus Neomarinimicrobiota bacterium]MCF7829628.1 UDP-N-acetylmuramate--L-alanine ligase [Candidatus Neomarinimicrobiota bacterium]MCF7879788.1 UDP-N-acetylmuramate--L-alanine ligase [Candidatus Neomarinimicrobiota bacterium]